MTHITRRLTAKNRDQLRNPTLCNRVLATFFTLPLYGVEHTRVSRPKWLNCSRPSCEVALVRVLRELTFHSTIYDTTRYAVLTYAQKLFNLRHGTKTINGGTVSATVGPISLALTKFCHCHDKSDRPRLASSARQSTPVSR